MHHHPQPSEPYDNSLSLSARQTRTKSVLHFTKQNPPSIPLSHRKKTTPSSLSTSTLTKLSSRTHQASPLKSSTSPLNRTEFSYLDDPNIDTDILQLYKRYTESRNNRLKSQTDYTMLTNKVQLLHNEESKIRSKENMYMKVQERNQMIKYRNLQQKEMLTLAKEKLKKKINEMKNNNGRLRQERDYYLKHWREFQAEENNEMINKIRNERKVDYERFLLEQQERKKMQKEKIREIHQQRARSQAIRKQRDYDKKVITKNELIRKIEEEEERKRQFDKASEDLHNESVNLMEKIKDYTITMGVDE